MPASTLSNQRPAAVGCNVAAAALSERGPARPRESQSTEPALPTHLGIVQLLSQSRNRLSELRVLLCSAAVAGFPSLCLTLPPSGSPADARRSCALA